MDAQISTFQCGICSKLFNRKDTLKVHLDQHFKKKKECRLCGKMVHPMALARHQKSSACNNKKQVHQQKGTVQVNNFHKN